MPTNAPVPVIRLYFCDPFCLTVEEWETMERELTARAMAGEITIVEKIALRLVKEHRSRYVQCKEMIRG